MSEIFSLIKESSIPSEMFANTYSKERYIETSINMLESVSDDITERTMKLYSTIAEANNVSEENQAIRNFIVDIQHRLDRVILDTNAFVARFSIAINNYADSARELVRRCTVTQGISYMDKYIEYNKKNLMSPAVPNMNPYRIFEREFNFIGQLMQELPVTASNKDKLDIVATVYDKFKTSLSTNDTNKRISDDIFGSSEDETSFSKRVTNIFKGVIADKQIDSDVYNDAVECINNSNEYVKSIAETANKLVYDLKSVISDLNDIVANSYKNKFKVDTKEDGIRNTIYSVDVYTSNKIMWFVQEKVQQITDVFNKYIMALSIKIECILGYVAQSSDIISSFAYMNGTPEMRKKVAADDNNAEVDDFEDGVDDEEPEVDDDLNDELTEEDDPEEPDDEEDIADEVGSDEESGDDDTEIPDNVDETAPDFEAYEDKELEEAVKEYYMELHELSCEFNKISIMEHAAMLILEEEEQKADAAPAKDSGGDNKPSATDSIKNAKTMVDKAKDAKESVWKKVIKSTVNLWNKFKDNIVHNYSGKVDKLKENEKYINKKPLDHKIEMPKIDHAKLKDIRIPDLNYNSMKGSLSSEAEFMNSEASLKPFAPSSEGESVNSKVLAYVIDNNNKITNANQVDPTKIYSEYCKDFIKILDSLKDITRVIETGEKKANQIAKDIHSNNESTEFSIDDYFHETLVDKEKGKENTSKDSTDVANTTTHLKVYFSTCGKVLAAKMTASQKVFNEYYAYLMWHINKYKKGQGGESSEGGEKKQEPASDGENSSFN